MVEVDWRARLRAAVARSGKKQSAIARDAGVAPETLSRVLTATLTRPSFDIVVRITHALNENVGWLLDERGFSLTGEEQRQLRKVVRFLDDTLLGSATSRRERTEPNALSDPNAEIPHVYAVRGARLACEVFGDSMINVAIADRDIVFVKPTRSTREANARVIACRVDGAEYVKALDARGGRIRLLSRNERYPPMDVTESSFELIGIVIGRTGALGS